ncbi:succinyldiaminopimelate transaminase [Micrococcus cohnii]|uniref:Aminotransferase n=1 Tax=Micrococcus cohnii TaxID=993416 RepID=A0A7W7GNT8_9MICC|nr:succinyldiaminopimelate transaminase [uncultured Micrococcus sp.]MBB4735578.1 succinyldiaminopimelate transaminase [Micrococcus cohnii]
MRRLPDYPWDTLAPYRERAGQHPDGVVDLSIGTPVDPTPAVVRRALSEAADAHGYPTTHGTARLRQAIAAWYARRRGTAGLDPEAIVPTLGSKEFIAWLPTLMGLGPGDVVVRPRVAYPTYDISARLAGAEAVAADDLDELEPDVRARVRLVWTNSPSNPTGAVLEAAALRRIVDQGRSLGAVVCGDECYAELGWGRWDDPSHGGSDAIACILDPAVSGGDLTGLLSVYSLSKQSNLAGYRAAFAAGDPELVAELVNTRKHAGMIVPAPVQAAMTAALGDDDHVAAQKDLYRARRERLLPALLEAGCAVDHSEAGLYLWARRADIAVADATEQHSWDLLGEFADRGIMGGPGVFYGAAGHGYVRLSLTASDAAVQAAADRLRGGPIAGA